MNELNILAVDDNLDNLFVIKQVISEYLPKNKVLTATSAQQGLEIVSKTPIEVALIDVQMPGMSGIEMSRTLKENPATSNISVILITAHQSSTDLRIEGLNTGADDFITKPIVNEELIARLKVQLRIKKAENDLLKANNELERRVEDQTSELSKANQSLHIEIAERMQAEEKIKVSLKEKETLLDEIHHRVKNNMAVIVSLLKLQSNNIEDNQIKEILKASQSRIYAMSAVHETLHGSENLSKINLKTYLSKITTSIFQTYSVNPDKVKLNTDIEKIPIRINQASPIGLIINELISNSLKYAFPEKRKGEINVSMKKLDKEVELTVMDNGVGMPDVLNWKNSSTLGLKLFRTLVENQLDGSIDLKSENGTKFIIKFNIET